MLIILVRMVRTRKCCVLNCANKQGDTVLHSFVKAYTPRFIEWVAATGNAILLADRPETLCNKYFVCTIHFTQKCKAGQRLTAMASPTLHLPGKNIIVR